MPAKVLPDKKVEMLFRTGLTPSQIRDTLLREDGIDVTPEALSMWRHRRGIPTTKPRHSELIPWRVKREHGNLHQAKMLRLEARIRAGEPISEKEAKQHTSWRKKLTEMDAVVHYDPDDAIPGGWLLVPRRPGIDLDLIRVPDPNE